MILTSEALQHDANVLRACADGNPAILRIANLLDGIAEQDNALINVLARVIYANDLQRRHGEDIIGVLNKCGAFNDVDVSDVSGEIHEATMNIFGQESLGGPRPRTND